MEIKKFYPKCLQEKSYYTTPTFTLAKQAKMSKWERTVVKIPKIFSIALSGAADISITPIKWTFGNIYTSFYNGIIGCSQRLTKGVLDKKKYEYKPALFLTRVILSFSNPLQGWKKTTYKIATLPIYTLTSAIDIIFFDIPRIAIKNIFIAIRNSAFHPIQKIAINYLSKQKYFFTFSLAITKNTLTIREKHIITQQKIYKIKLAIKTYLGGFLDIIIINPLKWTFGNIAIATYNNIILPEIFFLIKKALKEKNYYVKPTFSFTATLWKSKYSYFFKFIFTLPMLSLDIFIANPIKWTIGNIGVKAHNTLTKKIKFVITGRLHNFYTFLFKKK